MKETTKLTAFTISIISSSATEHCLLHQYQCANGYCIPMSFVCDHWDDCGDKSDEEGCGEWIITLNLWSWIGKIKHIDRENIKLKVNRVWAYPECLKIVLIKKIFKIQSIRVAVGHNSPAPAVAASRRTGFATPSMTAETIAMRRDVVRICFTMLLIFSF